MPSKWDSEFTEEKLQDQILAAIRWEEQDIDLGIEDILVAYQTIHKWLK